MSSGQEVDTGAVALEYSRLSRSVRQSLALEARLDAARADLAFGLAAERQARRDQDEAARAERIGLAVAGVKAAVGAAIAVEAKRTGDKKLAVRLGRQLSERLDDPREEEAFAELPVSMLVERVCKHLDLPMDWSLWQDDDWAVAEWRAGLAGSPYAAERPQSELSETPELSKTPALREPIVVPDAPEILCAAQARPGALEEAAALARWPPG
jgi:hypothetical protein